MSDADLTPAAATRFLPGPEESPGLDQDRNQYDPDPERAPPKPTEIRDIVRLFQCRLCSFPLRDPVGLPCGRTICKHCLPETHRRINITYPALPGRIQGFDCPFVECGKEHAVGDCGIDVVLNKAAEFIRTEIERAKTNAADPDRCTRIVTVTQNAWAAAGVASLRDEDRPQEFKGGKFVATYSLADEGQLSYAADVAFEDVSTASGGRFLMFDDMEVLKKAQELMRPEMDCHVCYALFYDPITTACGHTFCRSCLHRILDHSHYCPICRRIIAINPLLNRASCPSNERLIKIIETFWLDEVLARKEVLAAEQASQVDELRLPLFVCTLSFPRMPTFLHVFEPRYRLMIRRALEGNSTFGMVLPKRPTDNNNAHFHEYGTLLRIVNAQYYPDGRSLIETVGVSRFRVVRHGLLDGYTTGHIERVDDVSLEQEETVEAAEASSDPAAASLDINAMSTQNLMEFATSFVARMQEKSVPWMTERILSVYGECPSDAAIFPWWFASILPVKDLEKYRLLGTSSVRDRLKICCSWIIEWEKTRWMDLIDSRSGLPTNAQSSD